MADENGDDMQEGYEAAPRKKVSGKKLVLFIALPIIVLIGAGVGVYFSGLLDPLLGGHKQEKVAEAKADSNEPGDFYDLDEMLVTIRSTGTKQKYLKLQVSLELQSKEDEKRIEAVMPRIIDNFQVFLRELRVEELEGSEGIYRIKEELLTRVNAAAHPVKVKDVLLKNLVIQ